MRKPIWLMKDLIDLEYFLQRDAREQEESAQAALAERDREIYLQTIRPMHGEKEKAPPEQIIRSWLQARRDMETAAREQKGPLPGEVFADIYRLMGYGFLVLGIFSGGGLAFSLLNYQGTEPLNVSLYLAGLVLSQCLALLFLIAIHIFRRMRRSPFRGSVIFTLVSGLMTRLILRIKQDALKGLQGSKRGSLEAVTGLIRGKRQVYGALFYWPVFILSQIFGVGFNVGALAATLLKVVGSDIAFGWQSTIQFSAQAVFRLVKIIALPWSWIVPADVAYPSLSQIEGSHMVLKEGIYHLTTLDLVSWWPFLALAVFTYGLAPRLILLGMGLIFQRRALSRIDLGHAACTRLLHRLTTPRVSTGGRFPPPAGSGPDVTDAARPTGVPSPDPAEAMVRESIVALIPDDIFESLRDGDLKSVVSKRLGGSIEETFRFGENVKGDEKIFREISLLRQKGVLHHLLILQEAWQPPIRETLRFIQDLRKASGDTTMIWVGLIGRPRGGSVFTPVKAEEWKIWHGKLTALGDPYLGVERLAADE